MADRIIQTETLQSIANALRGGASQSAADKIKVVDFAEVAQYLKDVNNSFVGFLNKNATSMTIPEGVTSIGDQAFYNFQSISEINLPSTLISIGGGAFNSCTSLASITIPEGVTSIGDNAFKDCSSLTSISIPEGVTSIGTNAFDGINANAVINCGFSEGAISGAPWGAPETVTINYDVNN